MGNKPSIQFQLECVRAFTTTFRQDHPRDFVDAKNSTAELRFQLIEEEYKEWQAASPMSGELLDALVDLQYVTLGSVISLGLKYAGRGYVEHKLTGKKLSVDHYVAKALAALRQRPLCRDSLQPALSDLADCLNQAATANGFDMAGAFAAVHDSNMSKAAWTLKDIRPPESTEDRLASGQIVVYNKAGKVIKPPGFKPADLTQFVTAALRLFESPTSAAEALASSAKSDSPDPGPVTPPPVAPKVPATAPQSRSNRVIVKKSAT